MEKGFKLLTAATTVLAVTIIVSAILIWHRLDVLEKRLFNIDLDLARVISAYDKEAGDPYRTQHKLEEQLLKEHGIAIENGREAPAP